MKIDKKAKKMTKRISFDWIFRRVCIILSSLFLLLSEVCTSDETAGKLALEEARQARVAAERRVVQLELELEQSKRDMQKMRSRYADLYLRCHGLLKKLRQTELQVANLWHNKDESSLDSLADRLLEALDAAGSRQLEVAEALDRYGKSLTDLLDILQPSDALRRELLDRLADLRRTVEKSTRPLIQAAGKDVPGELRQGCRVVAVDPELAIVILDGGSLGGMTPESRWCLVRQDQIIARCVVIDVRLELSAAVVLEGSLTDIPVGSILRPAENGR